VPAPSTNNSSYWPILAYCNAFDEASLPWANRQEHVADAGCRPVRIGSGPQVEELAAELAADRDQMMGFLAVALRDSMIIAP
jgi:hypothetical protein